jgi:hypothetical protein
MTYLVVTKKAPFGGWAYTGPPLAIVSRQRLRRGRDESSYEFARLLGPLQTQKRRQGCHN